MTKARTLHAPADRAHKPRATRRTSHPAKASGQPLTLRAGAPDRDARAFLRLFNAFPHRALERCSIEQLRLAWRFLALALGRRDGVEQAINKVIDGPAGPIEMRVFMPFGAKGEARPAFLWCHGGGFMVGDLDTGDSICRAIARSGCIAIAVRYRLAPEHDLLAGREDFLAALQWVADNGAEWGIDTTRLAVGGDSAGGNISAAVAQVFARSGRAPLRLQVLAYPATELVDAFPSARQNEQGYMVTMAMLERIKHVIGDVPNATDPWLSPQRCDDLSGLPPALVISAGFDPIRDDGIQYAARLREAGVPVELLHYAGQFHGFLNFDAVLAAGRDALGRMGQALASAFAGEAMPDRTVEIVDEQGDGEAVAVGAEGAAAALLAWEASGLWINALAYLAAPLSWPLARLVTRPWMLPARLLRQRVALQASQTYPASTAV